MSHLVALTSPIDASHTIRTYPGFGILGKEVPAIGQSGASPVLNDGCEAEAEYHWRIEAPPGAGTLTIYPDTSFLWNSTGVQEGGYSWSYRLFENGIDLGVSIVHINVVAVPIGVAAASSYQRNITPSVALFQEPTEIHTIAAGDTTQTNRGSAAGVNDISLTDNDKFRLILAILSHCQELDATTGVYRLYAKDGVTVIKTTRAWEDLEGTVPYRGQALRRLDALQ